MRRIFTGALLLFAFLSGCASIPDNEAGAVVVTNTATLYAPPIGSIVRVIAAGLTLVDPAAYDGWAGECPGADVDARTVYDWFQHAEKRRLMLNEEVTKAGFVNAIHEMAYGMKSGDLLVVSLSGHGGQTKDISGDEEDGLDETICPWDGQMIDDDVMKCLRRIPEGVRVELITDTCHSEGNFRAFVRAVTFGAVYGRPAPFTADAEDKQLEFGFMRAEWTGPLIQLAGCREDSYSYGAAEGGTWTQTLDANLSADTSLKAWYEKAEKAMPANQPPAWAEEGDVQDSFRYVVALY